MKLSGRFLLFVLCVLLFATLFPAVFVSAETADHRSGSCGENVNWDLRDGILTISGTGPMENYTSTSPWNSYTQDPEIVVVIHSGVTSIGDRAFRGCSGITRVTIPNTVTSIGDYAFDRCSHLPDVTIPDSVQHIGAGAFNADKLLVSVTMGNGVKTIGDAAFANCTALKSITIPHGVTSIPDEAFIGCTSLRSAAMPVGLTSIGEKAFQDCEALSAFTIPADVTDMGKCAFWNCHALRDISIPDGVKSIEQYSFCNCISLKSVKLPNQLTHMYENAFALCSSLTELTLPESVTYIGSRAFQNCTGLSDITIPDRVKTIEDSAFSGCTGVNSVSLGKSVQLIGNGAFSGCTGLNRISIPDSVTTLGGFSGCSNLSSVSMGKGVKDLLGSAFEGCSALGGILLPDSLQFIGACAFRSCSGLSEIAIPAHVESIEMDAFQNCSKLTAIKVAPENRRYCDVDGVLFSLDKKQLFVYPGGRMGSYTIPDYVTKVNQGAFYGCGYLSAVTIPGSVTTISREMFYGCSALSEIMIPNSVTAIERYAFYDCTDLAGVILGAGVKTVDMYAFCGCEKLSDIYYAGSSADWANIKITNTGNGNRSFLNAARHYDWLMPSVSGKDSFVTRLYEVCLGRKPSDEDRDGAVWQLENGTTGIQLAGNFIFSDEFAMKNYCDRHFVSALYRAFMGREPGEEEIANWVWRLQQGDRREDVFNEFAISSEFSGICSEAGIVRGDKIAVSGKGTRQGGYCSVAGCTSKDGICAFVKRLYTVCLDRVADRNEIDAWHYNLVHGDYSATSAARFFLFSDEFKGHNYDDGAYVTHLYLAMLGREPDSSDLAYWVWELSANGMTRENAFERFAESDEFYLMCQTYGVIPQ